MGSNRALGAPEGPQHISYHTGDGGKYTYTQHTCRLVFPVLHLHTCARYTHGHTDVSFPCPCILRVKKTFIFSERSAEAEVIRSHFVFPANGKKRWPLRPCDEFRVHFLQFPFLCTHIELNLKKDKRCSTQRGRTLCRALIKAAIMHIRGLTFKAT